MEENKEYQKALKKLQSSEDWAYFKDYEKREIAFKAGYLFGLSQKKQ